MDHSGNGGRRAASRAGPHRRSGRGRPGRPPCLSCLRFASASVALWAVLGGCSVLVTFDPRDTGSEGGEDAEGSVEFEEDAVGDEGAAEDGGGDEAGPGDADDVADEGDSADGAACGNGMVEPGEECELGSSVPCTTPCATPGVRDCGDDCRWRPCEETGRVERCNGEDDDCDGLTDEGFECVVGSEVACTTPSGCPGVGACTTACEPPAPGDCDLPDDDCDGMDNDCDGLADEDFACAVGALVPCTTDCGTAGTGTCTGTCEAPTGDRCHADAREICNGLDDDCDTLVDDSIWVPSAVTALTDSGGGTAGDPDVAWNATAEEFGIVWRDDSGTGTDIFFTRILQDGTRLIPETLVSTVTSGTCGSPCRHSEPTLAWTGTAWAVAWSDARNDEIYFRRLTAAGELLGDEVRVTAAAGLSGEPALLWTGSAFGLAWTDRRDGNAEIYFAQLEPDGSSRGVAARLTTSAGVTSHQPHATWTGTEFGVAWCEDDGSGGDVHFTRVSGGLEVPGAERALVVGAGEQSAPRIVWNGDGYGLAWFERVLSSREIYFRRFGRDGAAVGPTPYEFGMMSTTGLAPPMALAWRSSMGEFVLAWADPVHTFSAGECGARPCGTETYFARIRRDGEIIDSGVRVIRGMGASWYPALAEGPDLGPPGRGVGVVWSDERDSAVGDGSAEIYYALLRCF